jgi:hypothetical protein
MQPSAHVPCTAAGAHGSRFGSISKTEKNSLNKKTHSNRFKNKLDIKYEKKSVTKRYTAMVISKLENWFQVPIQSYPQ